MSWICPNGCKPSVFLVCGGTPPIDWEALGIDPDVLSDEEYEGWLERWEEEQASEGNRYFQIEPDGTPTNRWEDGSIGVGDWAIEHAQRGCINEPVCPECCEHAVWVADTLEQAVQEAANRCRVADAWEG